jgi:hypothetical protein
VIEARVSPSFLAAGRFSIPLKSMIFTVIEPRVCPSCLAAWVFTASPTWPRLS